MAVVHRWGLCLLALGLLGCGGPVAQDDPPIDREDAATSSESADIPMYDGLFEMDTTAPAERIPIPGDADKSVPSTQDMYPWDDVQGAEHTPTREQCLARQLPATSALNTAHRRWGESLRRLHNLARAELEAGGNPDTVVETAVTFGLCAAHYTNQALTVLPSGLSPSDRAAYVAWITEDIVNPERVVAHALLTEVAADIDSVALSEAGERDMALIHELLVALDPQ